MAKRLLITMTYIYSFHFMEDEPEPQSADRMLHLLKVCVCGGGGSEQDLGPSSFLTQLTLCIFHLIVYSYFIHQNKMYDSNH